MLIHRSRADRSVLNTNRHDITNLLSGLRSIVGEIFDVDAGVWLFVEFEPVLGVLGQQVANLFVVDFQVAGAN